MRAFTTPLIQISRCAFIARPQNRSRIRLSQWAVEQFSATGRLCACLTPRAAQLSISLPTRSAFCLFLLLGRRGLSQRERRAIRNRGLGRRSNGSGRGTFPGCFLGRGKALRGLRRNLWRRRGLGRGRKTRTTGARGLLHWPLPCPACSHSSKTSLPACVIEPAPIVTKIPSSPSSRAAIRAASCISGT